MTLSLLNPTPANPFQDSTFAKLQLTSKKAIEVFRFEKNNFAYVFPLYKNYNLLYSTTNSPKLSKIIQKHNIIYTLIEEQEQIPLLNTKLNTFKQIIPRHTTILDLRLNLQDILSNMHRKGRYNINLAKKKDLTIKIEKNIDNFYKILEETALRDKFSINNYLYYKNFLESLQKKQKAKLFMAYHQQKPIAGILVVYIKNTAIYYYGASSYQYRHLMAPYLLQWTAIQDAKKQNYLYYDFLGIADPHNPHDQLKGVTDFKLKFKGHIINWKPGKLIVNNKILFLLLKIRTFLKKFNLRFYR